MSFFGGGGGSGKQIGVVPAQVNATITQANTDIKEVVNVLHTEFNNVLKALADNWGTVDGKNWVTNNLIPNIKDNVDAMCNTLVKIPQVIKSTAMEQARATGNSISPTEGEKPTMEDLTNEMKDSLGDEGLIGVYNTLNSEVKSAMTSLQSKVDTQLGTTATNIQTNCSTAFLNDDTASAVIEQAKQYVVDVQTSIDSVITEMQTQINENTENCETFERSIQSAGLQSGSGN